MKTRKRPVNLNRREDRLLHRRGKKELLGKEYKDNTGQIHFFRWEAIVVSFINFLRGCFLNGFPVCVKWLWYPAWAFYPLFFISAKLSVKDPRMVLNHERIHIRQQRDLHIIFSLPLCVLGFVYPWVLAIVPFVPTIFYMLEFTRVFLVNGFIGFGQLRSKTCFEMEATIYCSDYKYLIVRKFLSVWKFIR